MQFMKLVVCTTLVLSPIAHAQTDSVDKLMQRVMTQAHIPGAAVAIIRNGKVDRISTYGIANTEYNVPVTQTTPFQIASASKMYTGVLLMRMVEDHLISLNDPVTKYIPEAPASWSAITIRNLAGHSSGLDRMDIDPNLVATEDVVHLAFKLKSISKPGAEANYASTDYTILQYILEKISGRPFAALLQEKLFTPAGMTCTGFDDAMQFGPQRMAKVIPGRAEYYRWIDTFNQRRWFLYTKYAYAAGGAYSCAQDIATFIARIDAGKMLSPDSLKALQTPETLADGTASAYGIGWVVGKYRGHRWVGHSGGPAFSDVMYFPDDHIGVVVLTSQQKLHPEFASMIADEFITPPSGYLSGNLTDDAPALTAAAKALLEGAASGKVDPALFAPEKRADYVDDMSDIGPAWFGSLGPVTRIILATDTQTPDGRARRYRVVYNGHVQAITITYDTNGKIVGLNPEGD